MFCVCDSEPKRAKRAEARAACVVSEYGEPKRSGGERGGASWFVQAGLDIERSECERERG